MKKQSFRNISTRVYAINIKAMQTGEVHSTDDGRLICWYKIPAVWYKRKDGVTYACYGEIHAISEKGKSFKQLLADDSLRYITPIVYLVGRYDGKTFWGETDLDKQRRIIKLLKPMLKEIPSVPLGYSGWYSVNDKN